MDGGFSDNLPNLDENTVTVSPFCGESDIFPRDVSSQLFHVRYFFELNILETLYKRFKWQLFFIKIILFTG